MLLLAQATGSEKYRLDLEKYCDTLIQDIPRSPLGKQISTDLHDTEIYKYAHPDTALHNTELHSTEETNCGYKIF